MGYALPPSKRPKHLHGDTFKHFDLDDTTEGRRAIIRRLEAIAAAEADIELPPDEPGPLDRLADLFERGWVHGSDTFRELVLDAFAPKATGKGRTATNTHYRSSELGKAFTEAEAARILAEGLEHSGLDEAALRKPPKADWRKVAVAWAICERTTARQDRIAERLHLKSDSYVSQRVRIYRLLDPAEKSRAMKAWEKTARV